MSDSDLNNSLGMLEIEQTNLENKEIFIANNFLKIYFLVNTYYLKMQPLLLQYIYQYKYPNKGVKFEDVLIYKWAPLFCFSWKKCIEKLQIHWIIDSIDDW